MKKIIPFITLSLIILGCNGQVVNQISNDNYISYKKEFDSNLTNHFPSKLTTFPNRVINNRHLSKNDVGFLLYEYDVEIIKLDSIKDNINNISIAKYNSNDLCLNIVNRFETVETYENRKKVKILDSTKISNDCFKSMLPIPNFIAYDNPVQVDLKLDESFIIYVLEAKAGNHFKEFELLPNPQMPKDWKNGFSKGIAISREKKTLIYWGIIW